MKTIRFFFWLGRHECYRAACLLTFLLVAIIFLPQSAAGQHPVVPKLTLSQVEQLVSNKVPDSTLSSQIEKRGLAFAPTLAILESLRTKGAGPLTLRTIEALFPKGTLSARMNVADSGSSSRTASTKAVSILTVSNLFDYNGRKMAEWQPLLEMLKQENATITEANGSVNPDEYDITFWDACRTDNALLFTRIRNLVKNGKVIILTGNNGCKAGNDPQSARYSSQIANDALRDFGMELTRDDPVNQVAYPTGKNAIMNGVGPFLTCRNPNIKILDGNNVLPLAMSGGNILLAAYEDRSSGGMLVATGEGEGFLFGAYDQSSKGYDHKELLIMRNIISYARTIGTKTGAPMSDRASSTDGGPSLAATLQFIQDKMNERDQMKWVLTMSLVPGVIRRDTYTLVHSNVSVDSATCTLRSTETTEESTVRSTDATTGSAPQWNRSVASQSFSIKDIDTITIGSPADIWNSRFAKGGHPEKTATVEPTVIDVIASGPKPTISFHNSVSRGDNQALPVVDQTQTAARFTFRDEDMANRVAKAVRHAIELCSGGNKEPF